RDEFKDFVLLACSIVVASTIHGYFYRYDHNNPDNFDLLHTDTDFSKYSILSASPCNRIVFCANISGYVIAFSPENKFEPVKWKAQNQKIQQLICPATCPNIASNSPIYLLTNGSATSSSAEMQWFSVTIDETNMNIDVTHKLTLQLPGNFIPVCACTQYSNTTTILILGSRTGALALFKVDNTTPPIIPTNVSEVPDLPSAPLAIVRRAHGLDTVTNVLVSHAQSGEQTHAVEFMSAGRDGVFCRWRASRNDNGVDWSLECVSRTRLTKGWLEKLVVVEGAVLVCGFYDKKFFVQDQAKGHEVLIVFFVKGLV
ncbi:hypothetical protein HK096_009117, partial [Nowakowskiella sp. JEL0078]